MRFWISLLIFSTFWGSSFSLFSFAGIEITPFRIILGLVLFVWLLNILKVKQGIKFRITDYSLYTIIFFMNCFFTLMFANSLSYWAKGFIHIIIVALILIIIVSYSKNEDDINIYIKSMAWGSILTIGISVFEIQTGIHVAANYTADFLVGSYEYNTLILAPTALLYNPNNVAVILVLCLPCATYVFPKIKKPIIKWFITIVYYIFTVYVVLGTGSRGGIIIIVLAIILNIILNANLSIKKISSFFVGILMFITLITIFNSEIIKYLQYSGLINTSKNFNLFTSGDEGRFQLIRNTFESAVNNFFIGGGPWFQESISHFPTHAFILDLLADFGLVGSFCVFLIYIKCIKNMMKNRKFNKTSRDILIMLILFIPLSFIPPTIYTLYGFFIPIALAIAQNRIEKNHKEENNFEIKI